MRLSCELVQNPAALGQLDREWSALMAQTATNELMMTPLWLRAWWDVFGADGGRSLRVLVLRHGAELAGLVPLLTRQHRYPPGIPFRRLELLGAGEPEEHEICSEYLGPLARAGAEADVAETALRVIDSDVIGPWDELVLSAMRQDNPFVEMMQASAHARGFATMVRPSGEAAYATLPASWEAYLEGRSGSVRYRIRRSRRDLERWAEGALSFHQAANPDGLATGFEALRELHTARWSAEAAGSEDGTTGAGAFQSPLFTAFHQKVMPLLLERGALELRWISVGEQPIAAVYNVVWNDKVYYYQSGRRTDLPRHLRPGLVLHAHAIEQAIAAGLREYDFLAGSARFKDQLATNARSLVELRITRPRSWRELARRAARGAVDRTRAMRQRWSRSR